MFGNFPIWVLALDYVLGMIMWTLIARSAMNVFLPVDSDFFFMKFFVRVTDPILKLFKPITPGFLIDITIPLFVAWFFFMVRFYVMPWALGYSVLGMLSFPLEGDIAAAIYRSAN
ncbi:MAG: YggT family protein [Pseudomonadota bacterium]